MESPCSVLPCVYKCFKPTNSARILMINLLNVITRLKTCSMECQNNESKKANFLEMRVGLADVPVIQLALSLRLQTDSADVGLRLSYTFQVMTLKVGTCTSPDLNNHI